MNEREIKTSKKKKKKRKQVIFMYTEIQVRIDL